MALVVDSSCWVEIFSEGALAKKCQEEISSAERVIVPSLTVYEVYKKIKQSTSEDVALAAASYMSQFDVQPLTREIALLAADLSLQYKLGAADSFILAHSRDSSAQLLTLDNDFRGLPKTKVLS